jgi:thiamine-phosphate pyrophosphorylase
MNSQRPRVYLVTPPIADAAAFERDLAAALDTGAVAAVLLRLADGDERTQINRVKALAPMVQGKDVALLLDGHAPLVARGGADGAHLTGIETFSAALETLKPQRIAGCGGLTTRHDAMLAGERGADYVMFGEDVAARRPSFDAIVERVEWWSEIFEIPCVAHAARLDEVQPLAEAGADFIATGDFVWTSGDPASVLAAVRGRLIAPETVA